MPKTINYYFSLISPWTYLGGSRLAEIAARHGAAIDHKPVALAKIFPVSGGLPLPKRAPQRQTYRLAELERWREFLGIPLNLQPQFFPAGEWPAAGMVVAAGQQGLDSGGLAQAILETVWAKEGDIADSDTLKAIAGSLGLDGESLLAAAETDAVKAGYEANTEEALSKGVFGSPSYVFQDQLYWGQDRLDFLDRALSRI